MRGEMNDHKHAILKIAATHERLITQALPGKSLPPDIEELMLDGYLTVEKDSESRDDQVPFLITKKGMDAYRVLLTR